MIFLALLLLFTIRKIVSQGSFPRASCLACGINTCWLRSGSLINFENHAVNFEACDFLTWILSMGSETYDSCTIVNNVSGGVNDSVSMSSPLYVVHCFSLCKPRTYAYCE